MADASALAQLKDIHLPPAIGLWPPAWGWWLLFVLLVVLALFAGALLRRFKKQGEPKRCALRLLAQYEQQYQQTNDTQATSARISELLKRVALVYFPRNEVAMMHGMEWIDFLEHTSKNIDFHAISWMVLECPFNPNRVESIAPLITAARCWILQRKKPCSN